MSSKVEKRSRAAARPGAAAILEPGRNRRGMGRAMRALTWAAALVVARLERRLAADADRGQPRCATTEKVDT